MKNPFYIDGVLQLLCNPAAFLLGVTVLILGIYIPPTVSHVEEVSILLSMKSFLGDSDQRLNNWSPNDISPCSWKGVICREDFVFTSALNDSNFNVVGLDLSNMQLTGFISNEIGILSALQFVDFSENILKGQIPYGITNLSSIIYMNLTGNRFTGGFPEGFLTLRSLRTLDLYDNYLDGKLPESLGKLTALTHLNLGGNYFEGYIPTSYWNLTSLRYLNLAGNQISGSISPNIGNLSTLDHLEIGYNLLVSQIPTDVSMLKNLTYLDLSMALVYGAIPASLGQLSKLSTVFMYNNLLSDDIPHSFSNLSNLQSLDLSNNTLEGHIHTEFSSLTQMRLFSVWRNKLQGYIPSGFENLTNLEVLTVWDNSLTGELPQHMGRNSRLKTLDVSGNLFTGNIPPNLCENGSLLKLILMNNAFTGSIPEYLMNCTTLQRVRLQNNQISGCVRSGFGSFPDLLYLDLSKNALSGSFPVDLVRSASITFLDISFNHISGRLPPNDSLWKLKALKEFHCSFNKLTKDIPSHFGTIRGLTLLDLSRNHLSGTIPKAICMCSKLQTLRLNGNKLTGAIPSLLAVLVELITLDLSANNFSGPIPISLETLPSLEVFNVSYNNLSGRIPREGALKFLTESSFEGNPRLCGLAPYPLCKKRTKPTGALIFTETAVFFAATTFWIAGMCIFFFQYRYLVKRKLVNSLPKRLQWAVTSFQRNLNFTAKQLEDSLLEANIIGRGGDGIVYRVEINPMETLAVKRVFCTHTTDINNNEYRICSVEADILSSIRHRNIVKLLAFCSNLKENLLVFEYMENGSLSKLLHGWRSDFGNPDRLSDWLTRYNIALGLAHGLAYLHHDFSPPILHRDIKSTNILLDSTLEPLISDFGIAKRLKEGQPLSSIAGSCGYIAPECVYTVNVDEKSDVYSFGVVLLEILTGKQAVEEDFGNHLNIVGWVNSKFQSEESILEVFDTRIKSHSNVRQEDMLPVLRVAMMCTNRLPRDRPSMRSVIAMLLEHKPRMLTTVEQE